MNSSLHLNDQYGLLNDDTIHSSFSASTSLNSSNISFGNSIESTVGQVLVDNTINDDEEAVEEHNITRFSNDLQSKILNLERINKELISRVELLETLKEDVTTRLEESEKSFIELKKRYEKENDYKQSLFDIESRLIACEQYSRRECLVISGIPDRIHNNDLEKEVINILRFIGLTGITSYDIVACHRLPKKSNSRYPAKTIIKFISRKHARFCLENRGRLKNLKERTNMNLRLYESLCDANEKVLVECNSLKRYGMIHDFYIRNGFIKIIIKEGDSAKKIKHPQLLKDIFKDFYMAQSLIP